MHATTVVGYTFAADTYCPACTLRAVKARYPLDYPLASTILPADTADDILRTVAKSLRLSGQDFDPSDEWTCDSGDFPKVIFASDTDESDRCGACGESLS